jgi:hypothetical protein
LILFRKGSSVRVRRSAVPVPPYWSATSIASYGAKRLAPIAVDYLDLRATNADRVETAIVESPIEELERIELRQPLQAPLLIDAAESAEVVFRRGAAVLGYAANHHLGATFLTSTRGALPESVPLGTVIAIGAWPADLQRLDALGAEASTRGLQWGLVVPLIFPITTDLSLLGQIVELASRHSASFVASVSLELDQSTKGAIARSHVAEEDEEHYGLLFHGDLDALSVATERHLAALTHQAGMHDFIVPPQWEKRSNWNGAIVLTLAATRMLAMEYEVELAGMLARSARLVAALDKPLVHIAEAASLSIVEALDDASVDILTEWLECGTSSFVERVNERWRLRRDYVVE